MRTPRPVIEQRRSAPATGRRRPPHPLPPSPAPRPPADSRDAERAARAAGGPDDTARYDCSCGQVFRAAVTASVPCPCCGTLQAW